VFVPTKEHIRHSMLYEFHSGSRPSTATKNIQYTYGTEAVCERTCRRWFTRFKNGDFRLNDEPRVGRPSTLDTEALGAAVAVNPNITIRELSADLKINHSTIHRGLKKLGKLPRGGKLPKNAKIIKPANKIPKAAPKKPKILKKVEPPKWNTHPVQPLDVNPLWTAAPSISSSFSFINM